MTAHNDGCTDTHRSRHEDSSRVFSARRCPHINVRCTHGDEIIGRGYKRRVCLDCGRALDGPLPEPCSVTGEPHLSAQIDGYRDREPQPIDGPEYHADHQAWVERQALLNDGSSDDR